MERLSKKDDCCGCANMKHLSINGVDQCNGMYLKLFWTCPTIGSVARVVMHIPVRVTSWTTRIPGLSACCVPSRTTSYATEREGPASRTHWRTPASAGRSKFCGGSYGWWGQYPSGQNSPHLIKQNPSVDNPHRCESQKRPINVPFLLESKYLPWPSESLYNQG